MERFDIYFRGALLPGTDEAEARRHLGRLFGMDASRLDRLFSGRPVRIKQDVDAERAGRYRAAFRQAGALIDVVPHGAAPPTGDSGAPSPRGETAPAALSGSRPAADGRDLRLAAPGAPLVEGTPPTPSPAFDIDGFEALGPGRYTLEDCAVRPPPAPLPDLSSLRAAGPGEFTLEDCPVRPAPAPVPDTDHLSLAPSDPD